MWSYVLPTLGISSGARRQQARHAVRLLRAVRLAREREELRHGGGHAPGLHFARAHLTAGRVVLGFRACSVPYPCHEATLRILM